MRKREPPRLQLDVDTRRGAVRSRLNARRREGNDLVLAGSSISETAERSLHVVADPEQGCDSGDTSKAILTVPVCRRSG
jgi:hypothetical protein